MMAVAQETRALTVLARNCMHPNFGSEIFMTIGSHGPLAAEHGVELLHAGRDGRLRQFLGSRCPTQAGCHCLRQSCAEYPCVG